MLQENKYPFLNIVFNCSPSPDYFVSVDIYKAVYIHICMYDTCFCYSCLSKSAWIILFGTLDLVGFFELIILLSSIKGHSPAACLSACCGVCLLSKLELR